MLEEVIKYFPDLSINQKEKLSTLKTLYEYWNRRINVISRKDMDNFYLHHVLHSMAIARVIRFAPYTTILDVGTGGGFPGIPLAILFPESSFVLLDSIQKKIKVVTDVVNALELRNIKPVRARVEDHEEKYDFIVSRAVAAFPDFVLITSVKIKNRSFNNLKNGILYLKGGDLTNELSGFRNKVTVWDIKDFFNEPFFETKHIVYLQV
jgi:16S rRNA (guanine527-N7)-methyltransferase